MGLGDNPRILEHTISDLFMELKESKEVLDNLESFTRHSEEGMDYIASNKYLSGTEALISTMKAGRELMLKRVVSQLRSVYDYIIIDCQPSVDLLPMNALVAADEVIIPMQPTQFSLEGAELLVESLVEIIDMGLNDNIRICGILMTMVDGRTNETKHIIQKINETFGNQVRIFKAQIPNSVRVTESNRHGKSMLAFEPNNKITQAYMQCAEEIQNG